MACAWCLPIIALLVGASASTLAQAPSPPTSDIPAQQTTVSQETPRQESSKPAPKPAADTPQRASSDARGSGFPVDWWMMVFTGSLVVVAAFQAIMFWWQLQLLKKSSRDSRDMSEAAKELAEAAKASADIAQKMERAFVTAEVTSSAPTLGSAGTAREEGDTTEVSATVTLRNHGRTAAIIRRIHVHPVVAFSPPANAQAFLSGPQRDLPPALAIVASGSYETVVKRTLPKSVWQDAVSGKKTLFCGGKIEYDDVLAQRHETVFCWERSGSEGAERYSITFSDALNYFRFNLTGAKSESGSQEVLSPTHEKL
jgi:hypothetical protein